MSNRGLSWGRISFWLVFFFPVGVALLIARIKVNINSLKNVLTTFGLVIVAFAIYSFISIISSEYYEIYFNTVVSFIIGIFLLVIAWSVNRKLVKLQGYLDLIINQKIYSIDAISNKIDLKYDVVLEDLYFLIKMRYLPEYLVDTNNRQLVLNTDRSFI